MDPPASAGSRWRGARISSSGCTSTRVLTPRSAATCSAAWDAARGSATPLRSKAEECASRRSTASAWQRCGCRRRREKPPPRKTRGTWRKTPDLLPQRFEYRVVVRLVSGVLENFGMADDPVLVDDKHGPLGDSLQAGHVLVEHAVVADHLLVEVAQERKGQLLLVLECLERKKSV